MNDRNAVIEAEYTNIKVIHGRGVIQIVHEAPIEAWDIINDALGPPSRSTWCAIARLVGKSADAP